LPSTGAVIGLHLIALDGGDHVAGATLSRPHRHRRRRLEQRRHLAADGSAFSAAATRSDRASRTLIGRS
jgi:hypothetical protein